jgi:hypothetical protein
MTGAVTAVAPLPLVWDTYVVVGLESNSLQTPYADERGSGNLSLPRPRSVDGGFEPNHRYLEPRSGGDLMQQRRTPQGRGLRNEAGTGF